MDQQEASGHTLATKELYFLITKFLAAGPCQQATEVLRREIGECGLLPKRLDWEGEEHEQSFDELERKYPHIGPNHVKEICERLGPLLDKEFPPVVNNVSSFLGAGSQSLLRTAEKIVRQYYSIREYAARLHQQPLLDSSKFHNQHNIVKGLVGREKSGPLTRTQIAGPKLYCKMQLHRRTLGHLSAVYCVLFDRTGNSIITGADDLLVKVWNAHDGRLLSTLRGASAEITDIAVNNENTLLAAGSLDRILRVWCMQYCNPVAVLTGHTGMITSVNFCPAVVNDMRYLVTTSTDGSVAFWSYNHQSVIQQGKQVKFQSRPILWNEKMRPGQAQMLCASFSAGGMFLAAGSADHHVRVYLMEGDEGPHRILETEAHSDRVDSICWAHRELRFISGSKDGTACIWYYERQQWKSTKLTMMQKLPGEKETEEDSKLKLKVMMVCWDLSDRWVVTAVSDHSLKIWNSDSGALTQVLLGHQDEVFVLESHPCDTHVLLSAGHDGNIFVWDIVAGKQMNKFQNLIEGQGHGAVFDAKWSQDGTMIAATDSHGHLLTFGLGSGCDRLKALPKELFFHTDYRPLIRDANHYVLDEQTQMAPHLMPPPFLVDIDGNPYPPAHQRLVPGRENCHADQLVPNITVNVGGHQEVIGSFPQEPRSHIDEMIAVLAQRQNPADEAGPSGVGAAAPASSSTPGRASTSGASGTPAGASTAGASLSGSVNRNNTSPRQAANPHLVGMRRAGDVEGVRQSSGNWQRDNDVRWTKRVLIRPLTKSVLRARRNCFAIQSLAELDQFKKEQRRRPVMITVTAPSNKKMVRQRNGIRGIATLRRSHRANAGLLDDSDFEDPDNLDLDSQYSEIDDVPARNGVGRGPGARVNNRRRRNSSTAEDDDIGSSSHASSSECSDWIADQGANLEPPSRAKRKVNRSSARPRRAAASLDETHSEDETDDSDEPVLEPDSEEEKKKSKRKPKPRRKGPILVHQPDNLGGEIPEHFRPSEWLAQVVPKKSPYCPQMGDEVMFFKEGYELYLEAVRNKKVYDPGRQSYEDLNLEEPQLVKIVYIKYEIRPPRLCCLKLSILEVDGKMSPNQFTIKYHDMNDVIDFLVLNQTYQQALQRTWQEGDRFRSMINDDWWTGEIESKIAKSSPFLSLKVRWDSQETESMSPWDLEPPVAERIPEELGGSVPVLPEEIESMLYQPSEEEWPNGGREVATERILQGLEQVMGLSAAELFLTPVDLTLYPLYAYSIEYPVDLSLIKARFENHFYRRITAAQFDVRYLARNAEKFNEPHSPIVKAARIVTDLCLKIILSSDEVDVSEEYHQLHDSYVTSPSCSEEGDVDVDDPDQPGPSGINGTAPPQASTAHRGTARQRVLRIDPDDWRRQCIDLLELLWNREDAEPFKEPVDVEELTDYLRVVKTPMDLSTVRTKLLDGDFETPIDFAKDVRLIFANSKIYNTNKRSKIYAMTIRLAGLFEDHMKGIVHDWKTARVRSKASLLKGGQKETSAPTDESNDSSDEDKRSNSPASSNQSSASEKRPNTRRSRGALQKISDEEEDDESDAPGPSNKVTKTNGLENGQTSKRQTKQPIVVDLDSDDDVVEARNSRPARNKRKRCYESDNSYEPCLRGQKKKRAAPSKQDHDESDDSDYSESDDSAPKKKVVRGKGPTPGSKSKHRNGKEDSDDDDDDDEVKPVKSKKKAAPGKSKKSKKHHAKDDSDSESSSSSDSDDDSEEQSSDSEDSDESVDLAAPPRKTNRTTRSNKTGKGKSKVNGADASSSSSDDDEEDDDDDDDDSDDSDSSDESEDKNVPVKPVQMNGSRIKLDPSKPKVHAEGVSSACWNKKKSNKAAAQSQSQVNDSDSSDEGRGAARRRRTTKPNYAEEDSDEEPMTTVSSRGRVRTVTEKARALYKH